MQQGPEQRMATESFQIHVVGVVWPGAVRRTATGTLA